MSCPCASRPAMGQQVMSYQSQPMMSYQSQPMISQVTAPPPAQNWIIPQQTQVYRTTTNMQSGSEMMAYNKYVNSPPPDVKYTDKQYMSMYGGNNGMTQNNGGKDLWSSDFYSGYWRQASRPYMEQQQQQTQPVMQTTTTQYVGYQPQVQSGMQMIQNRGGYFM